MSMSACLRHSLGSVNMPAHAQDLPDVETSEEKTILKSVGARHGAIEKIPSVHQSNSEDGDKWQQSGKAAEGDANATAAATEHDSLTNLTDSLKNLDLAGTGANEIPPDNFSIDAEKTRRHSFLRNEKTGHILHIDNESNTRTLLKGTGYKEGARVSRTVGCLDRGGTYPIVLAVSGYTNSLYLKSQDPVLESLYSRLTLPLRLMRRLEHIPQGSKAIEFYACHAEKQLIAFLLLDLKLIEDTGSEVLLNENAITKAKRDVLTSTTIFINGNEDRVCKTCRYCKKCKVCADCDVFIKRVEAKFNIKIKVELSEIENLENDEFDEESKEAT